MILVVPHSWALVSHAFMNGKAEIFMGRGEEGEWKGMLFLLLTLIELSNST